VTDWATAAIALTGLGFVLAFRNREPILVVLGGIAGLLLHPLAT